MSAFAPCTRAVRAGIESDAHHGAVIPALHLSTNYTFAAFNKKRRYDYSRSGNPTRDLLAEALAELEEGAGAVVTASGMAAVALVLDSAEHHHGRASAGFGAQGAQQLQAVHPRHVPIQQDDFGHRGSAPGESLHAIRRLSDLEADILEDAARDLADHATVVNDE